MGSGTILRRRVRSKGATSAIEQIDIPPREILLQVISEAFWASYMKEEDRSVGFSLVLKGPSKTDGSFVFDKPIPFDSNSLLKLCPALDCSRQIIGVTENKREGKLEIWGFQTKLKRFLGVSYDESGLVFQALEPGRLVIRYKDWTICIVEDRGNCLR